MKPNDDYLENQYHILKKGRKEILRSLGELKNKKIDDYINIKNEARKELMNDGHISKKNLRF